MGDCASCYEKSRSLDRVGSRHQFAKSPVSSTAGFADSFVLRIHDGCALANSAGECGRAVELVEIVVETRSDVVAQTGIAMQVLTSLEEAAK